ncbi:MAG TPA: helix-turn-helix transcriptional regulator [Verrucomicrobiae bacterium]|jgi:AraC-like DNA-binding protein|nr:helix-turn-helix transcriptional regulator [Verrucomicrobiae bacterium]
MKQNRSFEPHLVVKQYRLAPGKEWKLSSTTWSFWRIATGVAYWLSPRKNCQLDTGSVLVLSCHAQGMLRASQLGEVQIRQFEVRPERLTGVVTLNDERFLSQLASRDEFTARYFAPGSGVSEKFKSLCDSVPTRSFVLRWQLLNLFAEVFGDHLSGDDLDRQPPGDARSRLLKVLDELPAGNLLDLDFSELVKQMGCTPRHLSRLFREVVGMSFREKQAQVRLLRAQELLATTQSKVVEVALESGYQSLSLFNLMFKRRFGLSPAQWRAQTQKPARASSLDANCRMLRA